MLHKKRYKSQLTGDTQGKQVGKNGAILPAMTRQWRIEFEGAYYHTLSRGNERRNIFHDNNDRISFLEILGKMSERFEVEVYAYVLMNTKS